MQVFSNEIKYRLCIFPFSCAIKTFTVYSSKTLLCWKKKCYLIHYSDCLSLKTKLKQWLHLNLISFLSLLIKWVQEARIKSKRIFFFERVHALKQRSVSQISKLRAQILFIKLLWTMPDGLNCHWYLKISVV